MPTAWDMRRRDLIGVGGSAGGLPALIELLEHFEPSAPATMLVVLHRSVESQHLADILSKVSRLEVCEPDDGETLRENCLYLASADAHLTIGEDHIHLRRGPRENNFRPAIDPLFRSLAVFGSTRTTAVVLSGYLDDGAAGARAVSSTGGHIIVQDPAEALSPGMPRAAISAIGEPEAMGSPAQLGEHLSRIIGQSAEPQVEADPQIRLELMIAGLERASMTSEEKLGELSPYNCPDCNGVLWEIHDGPLTRYRCHTGHGYTSSSLHARQEQMLERSLFDSLRACRERANFVRGLAKKDPGNSKKWRERAEGYEEDCALLEGLITSRQDREPESDFI